MRAVSLFAVLMAFWLLLSGHYTPFLVAAGALSSAFVVFVARHKGVFELRGGSRVHPLLTGALTYWPWALWQIVLANWDVFRTVWHPRLPIDPRMVAVPFRTRTPLTTTIYANTITLTPGTVTVAVGEGELLVHAISAEAADALLAGEMHERVLRLERPGEEG